MSWLSLRRRCEYFLFRVGVCLLQMLSVRQTVQLAEWLGWIFVDVLPKKWTRYQIAYDNIAAAFGVGDRESETPSGDDASHGVAADCDHSPLTTHHSHQTPGASNDRRSSEETLETPGVSGTHRSPLTPADIRETIRRMWVHLFRMVAEVAQLPRKMTLTNCRELVVFRNRKVVLEAFCSGRPVIVLGGHFGNWEVSMATFGLFGLPLGIVGRQLDNPYLNEWFARWRVATGHRLYLKKGASDGLIELLEAGGHLGLLCDQDAGPKGLFVDFFGRRASTFKSIALMALEYQAIIVVGYGLRLPDDFAESRWSRFEIGCEDVIDTATLDADDPIREVTQRYTSALERAIRRAPQQYFWVHRRWKSEPRRKPRERRQRAA